MALKQTQLREQAFELNRTRNRWVIPTGGAEVATIGGVPHSLWSTAVITWYRSHDGVNIDALETAVAMGPASPTYASMMSVTVPCDGFPFLIGMVTTVEGADRLATLTANLSKSTL